MKKTTTSITTGPAFVSEWLKYHYMTHKVTEIIMETSAADTVLTITLVGDKLPDEMNNDN